MNSFLIDENLPRRLLHHLNVNFPGSTHISLLYLLESSDLAIWKYAKNNNYCILTKDWDFHDMSILYGCPPKVVRLTCGNKTTHNLIQILEEKVEIMLEFQKDATNCYLEIE